MHTNESSLVRSAQSGDVAAFEELVGEHRERLFRFILIVAGNREDAEDALQETLLRAYRALPGYRGDATFSTWLHRVALTVTRNWMRSQIRASSSRMGARMASVGVPASPAPEAEVLERERTRRFRAAVAALPDRYREPILLCYYSAMSYAEIAEVLQIPVGTVRSRIARAKELLLRDLSRSGLFSDDDERRSI